MIPLSDLFQWGLFPVVTVVLLYYAAILSGLLKAPLMAVFRRYGPEQRPWPAVTFCVVLGTWSWVVSSIIGDLAPSRRVGSSGSLVTVFGMLGLVAFLAALIIWSRPGWREALPLWYGDLLRRATRQERRFIAYAWLRLPRRLRWRLSGDRRAFTTWADLVRITVIYGAYDPDSPWDRWR